MRVFRINGRFSQEVTRGLKDFVGYFIQENGSEEFVGYAIETYLTGSEIFINDFFEKNSINDPIRYIKGFYNEESKKLVFLKLSNCKVLDPLIYVFANIEKQGLWSGWNPIHKKFFAPTKVNSGIVDIADGEATIEIREITENSNEYEKKTKETFNQVFEVGLQLNIDLMNNMEEYKKFLNIGDHIFIEN